MWDLVIEIGCIGKETDIEKFRAAVEKEIPLSLFNEYDLKELHFYAEEIDLVAPDDFFAEIFAEFPKTSFLLGIRSRQDWGAGCQYATYTGAKRIEEKAWTKEQSKFNDDDDSSAAEQCENAVAEIYKMEIEKRLKLWKNCTTEKACIKLVTAEPTDLRYVPAEFKTDHVCMTAVSQPEPIDKTETLSRYPRGDGNKTLFALQYVPAKLKTAELCLAAMKSNGSALQYVPEELRTKDLCMAAVQNDKGYLLKKGVGFSPRYVSFKYVPADLRDEELCAAALIGAGDSGDLSAMAEELIPLNILTEKSWVAFVQRNGRWLGVVPKELRTLRVCVEAVKHTPQVRGIVPQELRAQVKEATGIDY